MTQSDTSKTTEANQVLLKDEEDNHDPYGNALPEGITSRIIREYMVGPYRYTDLAQATAQLERSRLANRE